MIQNKGLIALLFFLCAFSISAQEFGVKLSGGVSKISDNLYDPSLQTQKNYFVPSGQFGFFFNLPVRTKDVFSIELLLTQMEGKEKIIDTLDSYTANGSTTPLLSTTIISKHLSYLSLPILYGINLKKVTFSIGLQFSGRLMSSAEVTTQTNYSYNTSNFLTPSTTHKEINRLSIKDADFGETARITYHFTSKFSVEANYYYSFNNIYPNKVRTTIWKNQQITLGLRYAILTKKQAEK